MVIGRMTQDGSSSTTSTTVAPTTTTVPVDPEEEDKTTGGSGVVDFGITGPTYAGGVNPNYKAPDKSVFNNPTTPYLYKSDDWQIILKTPKDQVVGLQNQLMKAFPGWKPGVLGRINDDKTIAKVKDLLGYINTDEVVKGADIQTALNYYAKNPLEIPTTSQRAAVRLTSPIDLRPSFERGAQAVIGQRLAPEQTKKMVTEFGQMETEYQRGAATGAGGTVVQPPDPTAFAQERARKLQPTAAKATEYSDYMGILSELLQG